LKKDLKVLGYFVLNGKSIPIKATHDVFTRYMYGLPENAGVLRDMLNIFYERYLESRRVGEVFIGRDRNA